MHGLLQPGVQASAVAQQHVLLLSDVCSCLVGVCMAGLWTWDLQTPVFDPLNKRRCVVDCHSPQVQHTGCEAVQLHAAKAQFEGKAEGCSGGTYLLTAPTGTHVKKVTLRLPPAKCRDQRLSLHH